MNSVKAALIAAVSVLALQGCSSMATGTASPYTWPKVGTEIKLNQELSAQGGVRIYLQDGRQKSFDDVAKLNPYCQFYVMRSRDELRKPFTIEPDTFVVNRVFRQKDSVALEGVTVAQSGGGFEFGGRGGTSSRTMSTYMELTSAAQPEVTRMICSRWADPQFYDSYVSVDEIAESLGSVAQFIPPDK